MLGSLANTLKTYSAGIYFLHSNFLLILFQIFSASFGMVHFNLEINYKVLTYHSIYTLFSINNLSKNPIILFLNYSWKWKFFDCECIKTLKKSLIKIFLSNDLSLSFYSIIYISSLILFFICNLFWILYRKFRVM